MYALLMLGSQVMPLLFNYLLLSIYWPRPNTYDGLLGILPYVVGAHLIISVFSHITFIWAFITRALHKHRVSLICLSPFISMYIVTISLLVVFITIMEIDFLHLR